jgi:hypothetical protein
MTDNPEKKTFDLKDILNVSPEMLQSLQSLTLNNNENNAMNSSSILSQINTLSNTSGNKEDLKKKLRDKRNALKNNRLGKKYQEENQIKALKENPLFQNINGGNANDSDIKNTIESMASKMSNDPKQKKNIKKQMNHLIEKMKEP